MKKYSLFEFMFTLFIFALVVLFMAVPQALSRSPDTTSILILNIEPLTTFQAIENQFIPVFSLLELSNTRQSTRSLTAMLIKISAYLLKRLSSPFRCFNCFIH